MVQETPYTVHVTLSKKCVKEVTNHATSDFDSIKLSDRDVEVTILKQKIKDLETRLALAKFDFVEREINL